MKKLRKLLFALSILFWWQSQINAFWIGEGFEKVSQKISITVDGNNAKIIETYDIKNLEKTKNEAQWITKNENISAPKLFINLDGGVLKKFTTTKEKTQEIWKISKYFLDETVFGFFSQSMDLLATETISFLPNQSQTIKIEYTVSPKNIENLYQLEIPKNKKWESKYTKIHTLFSQNPNIFYHFLPTPNAVNRRNDLHLQWEFFDSKTPNSNFVFLWSRSNVATARWTNPYGEFSAEFKAYPDFVDHKNIEIILDASGSMSDGKWNKAITILPQILEKFPNSRFKIGTVSKDLEWWNNNFLAQSDATFKKTIYDKSLHSSPLGKLNTDALITESDFDLRIFVTDEKNFAVQNNKNWFVLQLGLNDKNNQNTEKVRTINIFPYTLDFVKKDLFANTWHLFRKGLYLSDDDESIFPKNYSEYQLDKNPVFWKRDEKKTTGFEPSKYWWTMPFWGAQRINELLAQSQPAKHRNTDILTAMLSIGKNFGVENFFFDINTSQNELQKFLWKIPETEITTEREKISAQTTFFENKNLKTANGRLVKLEDENTVWRSFNWWDRAKTPFIDEIAPFSEAQKNLFEYWPEKFAEYFALGKKSEFCVAKKCFRITNIGESEKNNAHKMWLKNMPNTHWSDEFVYKLAKKRALNVSETGTVQTKKQLSRAEFADLAVKFFELELLDMSTINGEIVFSDVNIHHRSAKSIYTLVNAGILKGYRDGKFYPNKPISRAEALKVAFLIKKLEPYDWDGQQEIFSDTNGWEKPWANFAARKNIINGVVENNVKKFLPNKTITLEEAAKILVKIFEL